MEKKSKYKVHDEHRRTRFAAATSSNSSPSNFANINRFGFNSNKNTTHDKEEPPDNLLWRNPNPYFNNRQHARTGTLFNKTKSRSNFEEQWRNCPNTFSITPQADRKRVPYSNHGDMIQTNHHRNSYNKYAASSLADARQVKFCVSFDGKYRDNVFNEFENDVRTIPIGFEYLKEVLAKEVNEAMCEVMKTNSPFQAFLDERQLQHNPDMLVLVVRIIGNLCSVHFVANLCTFLSNVCRSAFLRTVVLFISDINVESSIDLSPAEIVQFYENFTLFLKTVVNVTPAVAYEMKLLSVVNKVILSIDVATSDSEIRDFGIGIQECLQGLCSMLNEIEKTMKSKMDAQTKNSTMSRFDRMIPPEDYRDLSVYPTAEDLFGDASNVFIRPNKTEGAYLCVESYLDVQFRLLREDFVNPLRSGLKLFLDSKGGKGKITYENIRVYYNTRFESYRFSRNEIGYVLNFDPRRKLNVKWENSKRFMHGSLLIFTPDDFKTFFYGTVLDRNDEYVKNGCILVKLVEASINDKSLFQQKFMLIESEIFFEPYFHVMRALKSLKEDNFPMAKYIISCDVTSSIPSYLNNLKEFYINEEVVALPAAAILAKEACVNNLPILKFWPSADALKLDDSQHRAFTNALTSDFSIIQGPPGTGKTYIGLKIVKVLLENMQIDQLDEGSVFNTPILVICFTNHALDQFLEGILKYTQNLVRIGSQSKNEALEEFNLRSSRRFMHGNSLKAKIELEAISEQIKKMMVLLSELNSPTHGLIKYDYISKTSKFFKSKIRSGVELYNWLLPFWDYNCMYVDNKLVNIGEVIFKLTSEEKLKYKPEKNLGPNNINENIIRNNRDDYTDDSYLNIGEIDKRKYNEYKPYDITLEDLFKDLINMKSEIHDLRKKLDDYQPNVSAYNCLKIEMIITWTSYNYLKQQLKNPKYMDKTNVRENQLHDLPLDHRWGLYWSWVNNLKSITLEELDRLHKEFMLKKKLYEEYKEMDDQMVVKDADVIGMTTTGAARLHALLKSLKPQIVIIEEAAEVLESHVISSLTSGCQHVVLIGDHKQLKPSAAVYKLCKKFNFDISLFERMLNNGMYCPMLNIQHRMRPEICSLITPLIYKDLKNHESVYEFENIRGIKKNLFFLKHNEFEDEVEESASRKNVHEAKIAVQLCHYLILQGYEEDKITILTTYTGQMYFIRNLKKVYKVLQNVRVVVVDKYQGEENDIIILSLVRSNVEKKIGFLKAENRICVALSRAKIGMYILGNMDNLCESSPMWIEIQKNLDNQNAIGNSIELYCSKHDKQCMVKYADDFEKFVPRGGCDSSCDFLMNCGHTCPLFCHSYDPEHNEIQCYEKCLKACSRRHMCTKKCYEECGPCVITVPRELMCGHKIDLDCHIVEYQYKCKVILKGISPICGHEIEYVCSETIEKSICKKDCDSHLVCGHSCSRTCHVADDPDHKEFKCQQACERNNSECNRNHDCKKKCFEECGKCTIPIDVKLDKCGHEQKVECCTDLDQYQCLFNCQKRCPNCNAACKKKCSEDCGPCENLVRKLIPVCGHNIYLPCSATPTQSKCHNICKLNLACGHKCKSKCREPCGTKKCVELVKVSSVHGLCGHDFVNVECHQQENVSDLDKKKLLKNCDYPCSTILKCGDMCTGTCNQCWQGRLHKNCEKKCGRILICGHSCKYPCQTICGPCEEKCITKCEHSICTNKCGVPCTECVQPCNRKCKHSKCTKKCCAFCNREPCIKPCEKLLDCGHTCIGFCGDPCPLACKICDPEKVQEIFFGNEDQPEARFVLLEDCEHFFESKGLETYMAMGPDEGEIILKRCPKCATPISTTKRYMHYIKKGQKNIIEIKKKAFGNQNTMNSDCESLVKRCKILIPKCHQLGTPYAAMSKSSLLDLHVNVIKHLSHNSSIILLLNSWIEMFRTDVRKRNYVSAVNVLAAIHSIELLSTIVSLIERLENNNINVNTDDKIYMHLICNYIFDLLYKLVKVGLKLNEQYVEDFSNEIVRIGKMVDFSMLLTDTKYKLSDKTSSNLNTVLKEVEENIFVIKRFNTEEAIKVDTTIEKFLCEIGGVRQKFGLSDYEKRGISRAIFANNRYTLSGKGRWYSCENGHYYCITECDAPNEKANCPECKINTEGDRNGHVSTSKKSK